MGARVRNSLDRTMTVAPMHAEAHIAFGIDHTEIIDTVGAMIGSLTYGANKEDGYQHFKTALAGVRVKASINAASATLFFISIVHLLNILLFVIIGK